MKEKTDGSSQVKYESLQGCIHKKGLRSADIIYFFINNWRTCRRKSLLLHRCENVDELHKNAPEHFRQQRSRVSLTEKYLSQQIEAGLQFKNHILAGS